jgi:hypothetical protein
VGYGIVVLEVRVHFCVVISLKNGDGIENMRLEGFIVLFYKHKT